MSGTVLGIGVYTGYRHGPSHKVRAQDHDGLVKRQFIVSVQDQNTQSALEHRGGANPDSESQGKRVVKVVSQLSW